MNTLSSIPFPLQISSKVRKILKEILVYIEVHVGITVKMADVNNKDVCDLHIAATASRTVEVRCNATFNVTDYLTERMNNNSDLWPEAVTTNELKINMFAHAAF
jgi:hypothetical protein